MISISKTQIHCIESHSRSVRGWGGYSEKNAVSLTENGVVIAQLEENGSALAAPSDGGHHSFNFLDGKFVPITGYLPEDLGMEVLHEENELTVLGADGQVLAIAVGSLTHRTMKVWRSTEIRSQSLYVRTDVMHRLLQPIQPSLRLAISLHEQMQPYRVVHKLQQALQLEQYDIVAAASTGVVRVTVEPQELAGRLQQAGFIVNGNIPKDKWDDVEGFARMCIQWGNEPATVG